MQCKRPKRATKQKISHNMKGPKRATKQTALAHNKNEKDKCDKRDAIKRQCRRNKWQDTQQISKRSTPKPRGKHALRGQTHVGRAKSTHQGNENASGQASTEQLTHAPVGQPWQETTQRPTRTSTCTQAAATWQLAHKRQGSVATHTQHMQQHGSPREHTQQRSNSRVTH